MSELLNQPSQIAADGLAGNPEGTSDPILVRNKPVLLEALRRAGAASATISYSGSGDDGNSNEVAILDTEGKAIGADSNVTVAVIHSQYVDGQWQTGYAEDTMPLADALSDYTDRAIEIFHSGFEDGEGGSGEVNFACETGSVTMDHRDYYVEANLTAREL